MLQFMACEIPVVVNPIGLNTDILEMGRVGYGATTQDEWFQAFENLYQDREVASAMGREGRRIVCQRFGHDVIGAELSMLFKEMVQT